MSLKLLGRCLQTSLRRSYICTIQFHLWCLPNIPERLTLRNFSFTTPFACTTDRRNSSQVTSYRLLNANQRIDNDSAHKVNQVKNHPVSYDIHSDLENFDSTFQVICEELTKEDDKTLSLVAERSRSVLSYNILGGKKSRGLTMVAAYKMLSNFQFTPEDLKLAQILGWCIEILQGFLLVIDDIMDSGTMRRGKLCWHKLPDVGLEAINDAFLLECSLYKLLKSHFRKLECYTKILEEFHEVSRITMQGQSLDMSVNRTGHRPCLKVFTPAYYWRIVEYKTAWYTYCLPVCLAMHLVGSTKSIRFSEDDLQASKTICVKLGKLYQMQDDYVDAYGDSRVTGKMGTDIKEGKCTWLAVTALQNCAESEKSLMEEHYGVDNMLSVAKIMELYESLSMKKRYDLMEDELFAEVSSLIHKLDNTAVNPNLFTVLLNNIYKRKR